MHPILAFKPALAYVKYASLVFQANLGHLDAARFVACQAFLCRSEVKAVPFQEA